MKKQEQEALSEKTPGNVPTTWEDMDAMLQEILYGATFYDRIVFRRAVKVLNDHIDKHKEDVQFTSKEDDNWRQLVEQALNEKDRIQLKRHAKAIVRFWNAYH
jgi:hypothetical protein